MADIEKELRDLKEVNEPSSLYGRVLKAVTDKEMKVLLVIIGGLIALSLVASGIHLFSRAIHLDTFAVMHDLFEGFEFSMPFFYDFVEAFTNNVPIEALIVFLFNILLAIYIVRLVIKVRRMKSN